MKTVGNHSEVKYACAEGGAYLPIAHALHLPEPTKTVSRRFAPVLWPPSDLEVVEGKKEKKEKIMPILVATTHYVRTNSEIVTNSVYFHTENCFN